MTTRNQNQRTREWYIVIFVALQLFTISTINCSSDSVPMNSINIFLFFFAFEQSHHILSYDNRLRRNTWHHFSDNYTTGGGWDSWKIQKQRYWEESLHSRYTFRFNQVSFIFGNFSNDFYSCFLFISYKVFVFCFVLKITEDKNVLRNFSLCERSRSAQLFSSQHCFRLFNMFAFIH